MKLAMKLFALVGLVGVGILVERWRQQRLQAGVPRDDDGEMGAVVVIDADVIGLTEVDPEPMTQIAGEGIDPDAPSPSGSR
jgi:hypothetical protein